MKTFAMWSEGRVLLTVEAPTIEEAIELVKDEEDIADLLNEKLIWMEVK